MRLSTANDMQALRPSNMIALYISSLLLIALLASAAVWRIHEAYRCTIDGLRADNKDLRDRLFQKNALPPSGVDLTEKYEERQERIKQQQGEPNQGRRPKGPIEKLTAKWTRDDRNLSERKNIDATRPESFRSKAPYGALDDRTLVERKNIDATRGRVN